MHLESDISGVPDPREPDKIGPSPPLLLEQLVTNLLERCTLPDAILHLFPDVLDEALDRFAAEDRPRLVHELATLVEVPSVRAALQSRLEEHYAGAPPSDEFTSDGTPKGLSEVVDGGIRDISNGLWHRSASLPVWLQVSKLTKTLQADSSPEVLSEAIVGARAALSKVASVFPIQSGTLKGALISAEELGSTPSLWDRAKIVLPGGRARAFWAGEELVSLIREAELHRQIVLELPHADWATIRSERLLFGSKGAMLQELKRVAESLSDNLRCSPLEFIVPDFTRVPVTTHREYLSGTDLTELLKDTFAWIAGRSVMVRSSAVIAEDGKLMGAGVYESVKLPASASLEHFVAAVINVYESVNSSRAIAYRNEHGIEEQEQMGLIVQEFAHRKYDEVMGYVNTVRYASPDLLDVNVQNRYIPNFDPSKDYELHDEQTLPIVLKRPELSVRLHDDYFDQPEILAIPLDHSQDFPICYGTVARVGLLVEKAFGVPVQVEFVRINHQTCLVQVRPLPTHWLEPANITFPDRSDALWQGEAVGVIDQELPVLGPGENGDKEGIVIINGSHMATTQLGYLLQMFPKKGVVWVLSPSSSTSGHIESRALERGLTVISGRMVKTQTESLDEYIQRREWFNRLSEVYGEDFYNRFMGQGLQCVPPKEGFSKLRVVANGIEARVYPAPKGN